MAPPLGYRSMEKLRNSGQFLTGHVIGDAIQYAVSRSRRWRCPLFPDVSSLFLAALLVDGTMMGASASDGPIRQFAAGSLKVALGEAATPYRETYGAVVEPRFAPSGLLSEGIENGETAHLLASADMRHPGTLEQAGKGGPAATGGDSQVLAQGLTAAEIHRITHWPKALTGALLDRLTHHVHILEMNSNSYRLAQSRTRKHAIIN